MNKVIVKMEEIRKSKGITKKHIAEYCGKSVVWYSKISTGKRRVYVEDLLMIAEAMGEDAKNFFDRKVSGMLTKKKATKSA